MVTLGRLMNIGQGAMQSHQTRMATLQNNIANASTPGYRRQRVDLVTLGGFYGQAGLQGVKAQGATSMRAEFLEGQVHRELSAFGFHGTRATFAQGVEQALMPGSEQSLSRDVDRFFSSLRQLSVNPGGEIERRGFVEEAGQLTVRFRETATNLSRQRVELEEQARGLVKTVNEDLREIAELDREIQIASRLSQPFGDLMDQRDRLIRNVSEQISIKVVRGKDESVSVITERGRALVEGGRAREVRLDPTGAPTELRLLLEGAPNNFQSFQGVGGMLGGLQSVHDETVVGEMQRLDALVFAFATEFNAVHRGGFDRTGAGGQDFFEVTATAQGAASELRLQSAVRDNPGMLALAEDGGAAPGGSGNLQALLALQEEPLGALGTTLQAGLQGAVNSVARLVASSQRLAGQASTSLSQLEQLEASMTGVSLEEEMIAMIQSQRAFEAAMKVIQTGDQMFQTLLSMKG